MAVTYAAVDEVTETESVNTYSLKQRTIKNPISLSGIGLFTAEQATLTIRPAPPDTGIKFKRIDLHETPQIQAELKHVLNTPRCTILGNKKCTIHTVEHILAALSGMGVDNAILELNGPEVPIMDGSAKPFVDAILEGRIVEQEETKTYHVLKTPLSYSMDEVHLVAIPSNEFKISYVLHYPDSALLRSQYVTASFDPLYFAEEIAPSRTFCRYEEIAPFIENGLIKGGGLENAVIIKNEVVLNPDGTRFPDEMARHKILDLVGDLSLLTEKICAHIIAIRSGHPSNIAFAKKLLTHIKMEKNQNGI